MKTVPLGGRVAAGRVALVDDEDYDLVMQHRWHVREQPRSFRQNGPYAITNVWRDGRRTSMLMHTLITGWPRTDHEDHNGLNNQRYNLRLATTSQNQANQRRRTNSASRYKGVYKAERLSKWIAYIRLNGNRTHLGCFSTEEAAAQAYDAAAREAFGPFAYLNFPDAA